MEKSNEIRNRIAEIANAPLEKHGEIFNEINEELAKQLKEIESA